MNLLTNWKQAMKVEHKNDMQQELATRVWTKPPVDWIKININAACEFSLNKIGLGCLVRDDGGNIVRARSQVLQPCM